MRLGARGRKLQEVLRLLLDDIEQGLVFGRVGSALVLTNWRGTSEVMYHRGCFSLRLRGETSLRDVPPVEGEVRLWVGRLPSELSDLVNAVLVEISQDTEAVSDLHAKVQRSTCIGGPS